MLHSDTVITAKQAKLVSLKEMIVIGTDLPRDAILGGGNFTYCGDAFFPVNTVANVKVFHDYLVMFKADQENNEISNTFEGN